MRFCVCTFLFPSPSIACKWWQYVATCDLICCFSICSNFDLWFARNFRLHDFDLCCIFVIKKFLWFCFEVCHLQYLICNFLYWALACNWWGDNFWRLHLLWDLSICIHFDFWFARNFNFTCFWSRLHLCGWEILSILLWGLPSFTKHWLAIGDNLRQLVIFSEILASACILIFDLLEISICVIFISIPFMWLSNSCEFTMMFAICNF